MTVDDYLKRYDYKLKQHVYHTVRTIIKLNDVPQDLYEACYHNALVWIITSDTVHSYKDGGTASITTYVHASCRYSILSGIRDYYRDLMSKADELKDVPFTPTVDQDTEMDIRKAILKSARTKMSAEIRLNVYRLKCLHYHTDEISEMVGISRLDKHLKAIRCIVRKVVGRDIKANKTHLAR